MPKLHWMPFYPADYLADTARLTPEQHGAYLLLILDYWCNGAPPLDDAVLQRITRLDRAGWRRHKAVLLAFFQTRDGKLVHKRIEAELARAIETSERNSARARIAAGKRWGADGEGDASSNARSNAPSMPGGMLEQCPPPSPSQSQEESKPRRRGGARPIGATNAVRDALRFTEDQ